MKLIKQSDLKNIPKLYETEEVALKDKVACAKLFNPIGRGTWYIVEIDHEDKDLCFGYIDLISSEFGYFSLDEIESAELPFGMKIERDEHFKPTRLADIIEQRRR